MPRRKNPGIAIICRFVFCANRPAICRFPRS
jgi:hypothetical protein